MSDNLKESRTRWPRQQMQSFAANGLLLLLSIYLLHFARPVLLPLTFALLLSIMFGPLVRELRRIKLPQSLGALVVVAAFVGLLVFGGAWLFNPTTTWLERLPRALPRIERLLERITKPFETVRKATEQVEKLAAPEGERNVTVVRVQEPSLGRQFVTEAPEALAFVVATIFLLYFLLASGDLFLQKTLLLLPALQDQKRALGLVRELEHDLSRFFFTALIIYAGLGLAVGIVFFLLGVPNAFYWGVLAGALNFVPYVGPAITLCLFTLMAFASFNAIGQVLVVPAAYFALTLLEGQVITPIVMGRRLVLNPVVVLLGILFWGWAWGVAGMFLAVPLLVTIKKISENIESLQPVAAFLGR